MRFYAADIDGAYVGRAALALKELWRVEIDVLRPRHRGKGIAKALIAALEEEAKSWNLTLYALKPVNC